MKDYMNLTLQLNAFPTHFIINKTGLSLKSCQTIKFGGSFGEVSGKNSGEVSYSYKNSVFLNTH
jgi:hypothetical protein